MENDTVVITNHAVKRFSERCQKLGIPVPKDPESTILKLFQTAIPEYIDETKKVLRLITHGKEAFYMVSQGWRFVTSKEDGICSILTVERTKRYQN